MVLNETTATCPCGSHRNFGECCEPVHRAPSRATTPDALMRARFTAFARGETTVLLATWDPATRPSTAELEAPGPRWLGLHVEASGHRGDRGWVRFRAVGRDTGGFVELRETSDFRFDDAAGQWFYIDGDAHWQRLAIGRNAPCPCGSGLKAKRCCARD